MSRENQIKRKIINWLINHPWLKLISFILAILVWFYVAGELKK